VISYAVSQRTFEIGLRVALGAERRDIVQLVAGQGLRLAAMGTAGGVAVSMLPGKLLQQQLFGVGAFDGPTYLAAAGFLLVTAVAASVPPAWRALRIDPSRALQQR